MPFVTTKDGVDIFFRDWGRKLPRQVDTSKLERKLPRQRPGPPSTVRSAADVADATT